MGRPCKKSVKKQTGNHFIRIIFIVLAELPA